MSMSSYGGIIVSFSFAAIFSARSFRSNDVVPAMMTFAPSSSVRSIFTWGACSGMTTVAFTSKKRAAIATA
jgi:hypothetical protein